MEAYRDLKNDFKSPDWLNKFLGHEPQYWLTEISPARLNRDAAIEDYLIHYAFPLEDDAEK